MSFSFVLCWVVVWGFLHGFCESIANATKASLPVSAAKDADETQSGDRITGALGLV